MSSRDQISFTKENIDTYLKELGKEYRRLGGKKLPAELVLIGGASVLINYAFRDMTTDIDAVIHSASTMKEAINNVGDKFGLPDGWLNEDFRRSSSDSPKLVQYSTYYKSYYGVLKVRTISGEHLIAMKLKSGRQYKNDLSDILGILAAREKTDSPITIDMIKNAVEELYGSWDEIPDISKDYIQSTMKNGNYAELLSSVREDEKEAKEALIEFEDRYPGKTNAKNVDDIISQLKKKRTKDGMEKNNGTI